MVVDQFNDAAYGVLFRQLSRMPALEAFVKQASVDGSEAPGLPDSAFAWPDQRRFPIHTPEHAALSFAYTKAASAIPAPVVETIKNALEVYGVPAEIFAETQVKVAAYDDSDDYLLPELKKLPVRSKTEVKVAQEHLLRSFNKLDLENRATACGRLVEKAAHFQVQLHPEVLKLAGFVVSSTKVAREWLEARADALPEGDVIYKRAYQTLADGLKSQPLESKDRGGLLKLASVIADLDEKSGLTSVYDRQLPDALRTVFNTTKHAASHVDVCGAMVPLAKLAALPASFWEDLGGSELSNEVAPGGTVDASKLAMVVDTLPLDLKVVLKSHLRM